MKWWRTFALAFTLITVSFAGQGAKDPGPRPGPAGAGGFYPTLNAASKRPSPTASLSSLKTNLYRTFRKATEDWGQDSTARVAAPAIPSPRH